MTIKIEFDDYFYKRINIMNIFEIIIYVWISKIVNCAILAFNKRKSNYCILKYLFLFCLRDWRSYVFFQL